MLCPHGAQAEHEGVTKGKSKGKSRTGSSDGVRSEFMRREGRNPGLNNPSIRFPLFRVQMETPEFITHRAEW